MYIERDTAYNLLYVGFRDVLEKGEVAKTEELMPGAYFDFASDGKLLGIEIVNTERVLGVAAKDLRFTGELLGVKEAAELTGKDRANFLRDLASRPDFPAPVARVASGQLWFSRDVERYLKAHPSSSDLAGGRAPTQRAAGEEPTKIPYSGWEHREVLDTSGSAPEESASSDDVDHEVYGSEQDDHGEQESA